MRAARDIRVPSRFLTLVMVSNRERHISKEGVYFRGDILCLSKNNYFKSL